VGEHWEENRDRTIRQDSKWISIGRKAVTGPTVHANERVSSERKAATGQPVHDKLESKQKEFKYRVSGLGGVIREKKLRNES
jgi:hypothetical protein